VFIDISPWPDIVDSNFLGLLINFIKDAPATYLITIRAGFSLKRSGIWIVQRIGLQVFYGAVNALLKFLREFVICLPGGFA